MRLVSLVVTAAAVALLSCNGKGPNTPTVPTRQTIENVFQAHLPQSAANMRVETEELMTLVVYGTFDCSADDLRAFLKESRLLPDELTAGLNPLAAIQQKASWWHPEKLANVAGVACSWEAHQDVANCCLAAGQPDGDRTTVYFMVVYENKKQTGLRSDIKADPNWPE